MPTKALLDLFLEQALRDLNADAPDDALSSGNWREQIPGTVSNPIPASSAMPAFSELLGRFTK
jgi:hypothetical protein